MKKLICTVAVLGLATVAQAGAIRYVDDDAAPGGDGLSWATAYRFLSDALLEANGSSSDVLLVRVAQGTYRPDQSEAVPGGSGNQGVSFAVKEGLIAAGGYAGIGAPDPDLRDPATFETILSGDLNGNGQSNPGDSIHVMTANGPCVIDGFTITFGSATGGNNEDQRGGGLRPGGTDLVTVANCRLLENTAQDEGGAVARNLFGNPTLSFLNCAFIDNTVISGSGGAVSLDGATYTECLFSGNTAESGGAVSGSSGTFVNCTLEQNSAVSVGGAVTGNGSMTGCVLDGNTAGSSGGAAFSNWDMTDCAFQNNSAVKGGALHPGGIPITVTDCTFTGNTAAEGAALWANSTSITMTGCLFDANIASAFGGAIRSENNAELTLINCGFIANSAGAGGALSNEEAAPLLVNCLFASNSALLGGAIQNLAGAPNLVNCTLSGNTAMDTGGGIFNGRGMPTLTNCVLWGNSDVGGMDETAQIDGFASTPVVNYSTVQGGWSGAGGLGNISTDPMFVDAGTDDYRLLPGSPGIDAAANDALPLDEFDIDGDGNTGERLPLDLDGNPRFVDDPNTTDTGCGSGAIVDMGSYEFQVGVAVEANLGDIDGDEIVGITDFLNLLAAWGACAEACCLEDLDNDTFVGITDFLLLLGNWG